MKKLISLLFVFFMLTASAHAKSLKNGVAAIINDSGIKKDSIAISVKDIRSGKTIYSLNDKIMMNPASIQKVLTMTAAENTLGSDYKFSTELYSEKDDAYLIKLSGDPYLKYSDLKTLTKTIKQGTKNIYIDDSILDSKCWGEGWQWDDDMNELMPRFGAYNLDKNLIKLSVVPSENGKFATIINPSKYPLVFVNNITNSDKTSINISRETAISANTLIMNGTVSRKTTVYVPSNDIKQYFNIQLTRALGENKVYLRNPFTVKKKTSEDILAGSTEHELSYALDDILKNSNNMAAETVFKLAGGKYKGESGSD